MYLILGELAAVTVTLKQAVLSEDILELNLQRGRGSVDHG